MIAAHDQPARRHAGGGEQGLDFPQRVRGRARVGRVDRYIGIDRAGSFMEPGLRQSHHIGALGSGKAAARMADEDDDRLIGFLDGDRMALAIIVGNARRHRLVGMRAGAERHGETDKRSGDAQRAGDATRDCDRAGIWAVIVLSSSRLSR